MSGKEERGELRIQIKQFLWPDCKACGGKCKTAKAIEFCKYSQHGIPKQEAIEVMAKAIFSKSGFPKDCIWEKINEETKTAFRLYAREALNALLEGGK